MKLNLNAPFFQFINTAFDFVILNICFILTCLPVFTIGAALTALYTVTMAEAEDKGLPFTKTYFQSASLLFAGCICIGALLLFCLFFWLSFESLLALIPSVLSLAALIALVICLILFFFWPGMNVPPGSFYSMPCLSAPPICLLPDCLP